MFDRHDVRGDLVRARMASSITALPSPFTFWWTGFQITPSGCVRQSFSEIRRTMPSSYRSTVA
nr:hypothetical protein [Halovivax sp. KZCA124]